MTPSKQTKLYGLNKYFKELKNLYDNEKIPNKILLSGKKENGKSTLSYHFINYVLSKKEDNKYNFDDLMINEENKSFNLLNNKCHPNFYLIDLFDDKKNIEINHIREMITWTRKSNCNDTPRFVLIDNIEKLNPNSTNALLKIIEEPNFNIFFILIHNNKKKILSTLNSRCLNFKINLSFNQTIDITNKLLNADLFSLMNNELINFYNSPGDFINILDFANEKKIDLKDYTLTSFIDLLIDSSYYKKIRISKI